MDYKKLRASHYRALERPNVFSDVHVIIGGTGAVGGTTAFHLESLYEELMEKRKPSEGEMPRIVITGLTKNEIRKFTTRIFQYCEMKYGKGREPVPNEKKGYITPSGIFFDLRLLSVKPEIPDLSDLNKKTKRERAELIEAFLNNHGYSGDTPVDQKTELLKKTIKEKLQKPFTGFLELYKKEQNLPDDFRFQSVVIGIPLASVCAYHLTNLEEICRLLGITDPDTVEDIKTLFLEGIRDDLAQMKGNLANEILIAHTTAVGGMYDATADGKRIIRMGFAHSALDERLRYKQIFAEKLSNLYAGGGANVLVTAAAIGIDGVTVRKSVPIKGDIKARLEESAREGTPILDEKDLREGILKAYKPITTEIGEESAEPVQFDRGHNIICDYVVQSGENGFFSIANADALYRIMKVTSPSELSVVLSNTAIAGDDPLYPWFPNNVCYYDETDNSRMVFDFLYQPQIFNSQLKGLEPQALQDLGSAKHQGELHTLNLLILLHRLRTLNLDILGSDTDLEHFNARNFFVRYSHRLTFEDIMTWDMEKLHSDLKIMATACEPSDLAPINPLKTTVFPSRNEAYYRILKEVLHAIWAIPSLGSSFLFEKNGKTFIKTGYYVAPLDILMKSRNSITEHLYESFKKSGKNRGHYDKYLEFHFANNGFVDLRPSATLVTAKKSEEDLSGKVKVFRNEEDFEKALSEIEPYSYFTSSGLIALMYRLKGLFNLARSARIELGTLCEYRLQIPRDEAGNILLVPGVVEAFRMQSEGLEKNTGTERISGFWGYTGKK